MNPFKVPVADRQYLRRNAGSTTLSCERVARRGADHIFCACAAEALPTVKRRRSFATAAARACKCGSHHAFRIAKSKNPNSSNLIIMIWLVWSNWRAAPSLVAAICTGRPGIESGCSGRSLCAGCFHRSAPPQERSESALKSAQRTELARALAPIEIVIGRSFAVLGLIGVLFELLGTNARSPRASTHGVFIAPIASCCAGSSPLITHAESKPSADTAMTIETTNKAARTMVLANLFIACFLVRLDWSARAPANPDRCSSWERENMRSFLDATIVVPGKRIATRLGEKKRGGARRRIHATCP
jgi:hypothetical protein